MGQKPEDLEKRIASREYGFSDALRMPTNGIVKEVLGDFEYRDLLSGSMKRKNLIYWSTLLASFGLTTIPHELIHADVNKLTGGVNEKIVINRLFGGDLVNLIYSGIESELLFPLIGGYTEVAEFGSLAGQLSMVVAPYVMTPVGIYLATEGKKRKSWPLVAAGSGAVVLHVSAPILGDLFSFGKTVVYESTNFVTDTLGFQRLEHDNMLFRLAVAAGGFYLGWKSMGLTYRLSKAAVNHCRNLFKKKDKPDPADAS